MGGNRPSKCLNHHNHQLCKIFLAGVNLLRGYRRIGRGSFTPQSRGAPQPLSSNGHPNSRDLGTAE